MEQEQTTLQKNGYTIENRTENGIIATKDGDRFLITKIKISTNEALISKIETLKMANHPHVVSISNSFKDEDHDACYVVMEYCQGGSLVEKIREGNHQESEVLSWIVEICMALKTLHENGLVHIALTPQDIFFTEFGTLHLSRFRKIQANDTEENTFNYTAPEILTKGTNDVKSEIWSLGCILYEVCTEQLAFSAENTVILIPKIISGPDPCLQGEFSSEFRELLSDMLIRDPESRPTAGEILGRPITLRCLKKKCETTTEHLQTQLDKLKAVADSLEKVHERTTIGSLTGGVIGAAGGITSIVGLALAPFTMGTSLLVTGAGVALGTAGGLTAGASNITNIVHQASDRKVVQSIIKELEEKINALALWIQEISDSLEAISKRYSGDIPKDYDSSLNPDTWTKVGRTRVGKGLGSVAEVVRLLRVSNIGKIAAQTSRAVRVAEVASGALAGLFVAADVFFIAMDAKEIRHIRQAKAGGKTCSDTMKFVLSIRHAADEFQRSLDELRKIMSNIPSLEDEQK